MRNGGTLYSVFRREKFRQYQNLSKHMNGILSALFLIAAGLFLMRNQLLPARFTSKFHQQKFILNFTDLRECTSPSMGSSLIKMTDECLYIFSVLGNYGNRDSLLTITLNIWDGTYTDSTNLLCCMKSKNDDVLGVSSHKLNPYHIQSSFQAGQINCHLDTSRNFKPTHVALSKGSCTRLKTKWIPVEYVKSYVDQIAVCTGVTHGQIIPERLTEWFELQKILGIEKVVTYVYKLHNDTLKVLEYYKNEGLLDILQYDLPGTIRAKQVRGFLPEERWYPQFENDNQVALFDCQERLRGYKYLIVNSFSEVFVPRGEILNLYDLLEYRLRVEYHTASSFSFPVKTFITEWSKSDPENELFYLQYLLRAPVNKTRTRSIFIPSRTLSLSEDAVNHYYYQRKDLSEDIISLHEYRDCEANENQCFSALKYHDGDLFPFERILKDKMREVPAEFRREF